MIAPQHTFILIWDLDIDDYSIEDRLSDMLRLNTYGDEVDFRQSLIHPNQEPSIPVRMWFSINNWQHACKGDRFFTLCISQKEGFKNRIVDSGFFLNIPYYDGRWTSQANRQAKTVGADFDVVLHPLHSLDLLNEDTLSLQFPDYDWSGETTDFMLDEQTARLLENKWYYYLAAETPKLSRDEFWCRSKEGIESMYSWQDSKGNYDMGRAMLYLTQLNVQAQLKKH